MKTLPEFAEIPDPSRVPSAERRLAELRKRIERMAKSCDSYAAGANAGSDREVINRAVAAELRRLLES